MISDWTRTSFGAVTRQVREVERVQPGKTYGLLGVRWYAEGAFLRESVTSETSKAKVLYAVKPGYLVYNRLFAWKGSFGVVGQDLAGSFVSNEFPLFAVDETVTSTEYLQLVLSNPRLWAQVEEQSTGSAAISRSRWNEDRFAAFPLLLPPPPVQRQILDAVGDVTAQASALSGLVAATDRALSAARETVLQELIDQPLVPLADLASIECSLVDPTAEQYRRLPHLGIDRIESRTGRSLPMRSALEDGVTSGKFLFATEDVVYSKIRPELRKAAFPQLVGLASADAYPLRPKASVNPGYLLKVLLSNAFTDEAVARSSRTKMPKINRADLFCIEVPQAPEAVQTRVSKLTHALRTAGQDAAKELASMRGLRLSLLDGLVSGTIPLHEAAAA